MRASDLLVPIRRLHERIRDSVVAAFERSDLEEMSSVAKDQEGDTLYAVDRVSESVILEFFEEVVSSSARRRRGSSRGGPTPAPCWR